MVLWELKLHFYPSAGDLKKKKKIAWAKLHARVDEEIRY